MLQLELVLNRILAFFDPLALKLGVDTDKLVHGLGCALMAAVFMLLGAGPSTAFLGALVIGIGWEGVSYVWRRVDPDPEDVLADFVGAGIPTALVGLVGLLA